MKKIPSWLIVAIFVIAFVLLGIIGPASCLDWSKEPAFPWNSQWAKEPSLFCRIISSI